jgi:hypothetical protein
MRVKESIMGRARTRPGLIRRHSITVAFALIVAGSTAQGQTFNSGSTGADGPLDFTGVPAGTVIDFDPVALGFDPERDNVYHFTTITVPPGVTIRLADSKLHGPVFWLASGAVLIRGTLDLNGKPGHDIVVSPALRVPAEPGAGGFSGGIGGHNTGTAPPQQGLGPGGGPAGTPSTNGLGTGGSVGGNEFLVPLFGGSGGGGGLTGGPFDWGGGGGAGGGAIAIASSVSITIDGSIVSEGGRATTLSTSGCAGGGGGGGSGGAIRLAAPTVRGSGTLAARGGQILGGACVNNTGVSFPRGGAGRVRIEAFQHEFGGTVQATLSKGSPVSAFLPPGPTSVRVVSIAGVGVPVNPTGSFTLPDVTIDQGAAVPVQIEAHFVPPGTVVKLHLFSLEGPDQIVSSAPLAGSLESSIATATVTFPAGFTRGFARAVWR